MNEKYEEFNKAKNKEKLMKEILEWIFEEEDDKTYSLNFFNRGGVLEIKINEILNPNSTEKIEKNISTTTLDSPSPSVSSSSNSLSVSDDLKIEKNIKKQKTPKKKSGDKFQSKTAALDIKINKMKKVKKKNYI